MTDSTHDEQNAPYSGQDGLVSVIMPTFNSARFVAESIESILAQTYTQWELIVTDDCSTDGTIDILQRYASRDSRIVLQRLNENSGAGVARNTSIRSARGRYIAFCDSDDRWTADKLATQLKFMQANDVAMCFAPYYTCDESGETTGYVPAPKRVTLFSTMCDDKIGFLTCIFDANKIGKHFMPIMRRRQDYAYVLQLLRICREAHSVPTTLAFYRHHDDNLSGRKVRLLRYNALTYTTVFGWPLVLSYAFLFVFFLPCYFVKRLTNMFINKKR